MSNYRWHITCCAYYHHHLPAPSQTILGSAVRVLWVHKFLFSASSSFSPFSSMSALTQSIHLCLGLSLPLCPSTSSPMPSLLVHLLPSLVHAQTISNVLLSSYQQCLSLRISSVFPHSWSCLLLVLSIHRSILISVLLIKSSTFLPTAQHSTPYISTGLTAVLYSLHFSFFGIFRSHYPCDFFPLGPSHFASLLLLLFLYPDT